MKKITLLLLTICFSIFLNAQSIIKLPYENPKGLTWANAEKEYFFDAWKTEIVTNISVPTMEVFKPADSISNGTAVIIAPGGGMFLNSITKEGNDVAAWLIKKGVTAVVLKYRLVATGTDGGKEVLELPQKDYGAFIAKVSQIMPFAVNDALNAVDYVRKHAAEYGITKNKIGLMGFSSGGSVTLGVTYYCKEENRPDFIATLYPGTTLIPTQTPRKDAPPLFIVAAENDYLGLAPGAVQLYNAWSQMGLKAELHLYTQGSHGFGMSKQNLPSDSWIERFNDWAIAEGFITVKK